MKDISRRTLVQGGALLAAAAAAPAAHAGQGRLSRRVARLRRKWDEDDRKLLGGLVPDGRFSQNDPLIGRYRAIARGTNALNLAKVIMKMPIPDQAKPVVQELIREAATAYGRALLGSNSLVESFLSGATPADDVQLRGAVRALRLSLTDFDAGDPRKDMAHAGARRIEEAPDLHTELRRMSSRMNKMERLADRAARDGDPLDLLGPPTPAMIAQLEDEPPPASTEPTADPNEVVFLVLGLVLMGAVAVGGVILFGAGLCSISCGDPIGIAMALGGLALIGLAVWGGTRLTMRLRQIVRGREEDEELVLDWDGAMNVHPQDGWTESAHLRTPDAPIRFRASGRVHGPWGWLASPQGDGVAAGPDALMPGAPEAALVARVGDEHFFLGSEGEIPAGPVGPIELALNVASAQRARTIGFFHVQIA